MYPECGPRWQRGAEATRTPGLLHAMQALYQLSYSPAALNHSTAPAAPPRQARAQPAAGSPPPGAAPGGPPGDSRGESGSGFWPESRSKPRPESGPGSGAESPRGPAGAGPAPSALPAPPPRPRPRRRRRRRPRRTVGVASFGASDTSSPSTASSSVASAGPSAGADGSRRRRALWRSASSGATLTTRRYSCGVAGYPYSSRMSSMISSATRPSAGRVCRTREPRFAICSRTDGSARDAPERRRRRRPPERRAPSAPGGVAACWRPPWGVCFWREPPFLGRAGGSGRLSLPAPREPRSCRPLRRRHGPRRARGAPTRSTPAPRCGRHGRRSPGNRGAPTGPAGRPRGGTPSRPRHQAAYRSPRRSSPPGARCAPNRSRSSR